MRITLLFLLGLTLTAFTVPDIAQASERPVRRKTSVTEEEISEKTVSYRVGRRLRETRIYCYGITPGKVKQRRQELIFTPLSSQLKKLRKRGAAKAKVRQTRALLKAAKISCSTPEEPEPTPTPSPSPSPSPSPTPPVMPQFFDDQGNLTELGRLQLDIPDGLSANMYEGQAVQTLLCFDCHDENGRYYSFPELRQRTSEAPMFFDTDYITDEQLANLVAWLFRP